MGVKRKSSLSSAAPGRSNSIYQNHDASSSKKRLIADMLPPLYKMADQRSKLTSPSLENIVTGFDRLHASNIKLEDVGTDAGTPITNDDESFAEDTGPKTFLIIGASRGIGLEFARQLLERQHQVIAVVRNPATASQLWQVTGSVSTRPGSCIIEQCDVSSSEDIDAFVTRMRIMVERGGAINTIILNAGILEYSKGLGSLDVSFENLSRHLSVNCIGNIVLARKLLLLNDLEPADLKRRQLTSPSHIGNTRSMIGQHVIFISSDSASMTDFREYEDGFATYGASKAALNMMIRHMASELRRKAMRKGQKQEEDQKTQDVKSMQPESWEGQVCVLAMHPGEVNTDMANIEIGWDVEGVISPQESVSCMLQVLRDKKPEHSGTFWRWDGKQHPW